MCYSKIFCLLEMDSDGKITLEVYLCKFDGVNNIRTVMYSLLESLDEFLCTSSPEKKLFAMH